MAFYNRKIAKNKSLARAWRAAHFERLDSDDEIRLPEICDEIALWMRRDRRPRSRLSLRSFSVLLSGAIRLYNQQLSRLLKDTFKCSLFNSVTSSPVLTPAEKIDLGSTISDVSSSSESESESIQYPDHTESSSIDNLDENMPDDESTVFTVTPNKQRSTTDEQEESEGKSNKQTQTSPKPKSVEIISGIDPNLPFGYVLVHENYHSRIPSKILFSSLSENVKFLQSDKPMN